LAVDGSKIEAVASRKKVITAKSLAKKAASIDGKIAEYMGAMDRPIGRKRNRSRLLATLRGRCKRCASVGHRCANRPSRLASESLSQLVVSEPESRLMRTARHGHQVATIPRRRSTPSTG
jgi:hypothetical protein